jgi:hypothetical protein
MKQHSKIISNSTVISFNWWRGDDKDIPEAHIDALNESAMQLINEQIANDMREGELTDNIRMTNDEPIEGIAYRGYWKNETAKAEELSHDELEYVNGGGCRCINPDCKSENIEGGGVEVDAGSCFQPVTCNDCGTQWNDAYNLVGIDEVVIGDDE